MWLVAAELDPPFANQLVLEGTGVLDVGAWRDAARLAGEANPGLRLVLRGHMLGSRLVDSGVAPRVVEVDASGWDGYTDDGADFLLEPLPPRAGPTCEVVLAQGPTPRVVIRTHHAVTDGRGAMVFAGQLFRALRGEPPVVSQAKTTDLDIARALNATAGERRHPDCLALTGASQGEARGRIWRRRSLSGKASNLLPRVAVALAELARENAVPGVDAHRVRFDIPVDMRRHLEATGLPGTDATANMTGVLHIDVEPGHTPDDIRRAVKEQIAEGRDAEFSIAHAVTRYLPRFLMRPIGNAGAEKAHASNTWLSTGLLSNLGRMDPVAFSGGGFQTERWFAVPPSTEGTGFFMALSGSEHGADLCAMQPLRLGGGGRLDACLDRLMESLEETSSARVAVAPPHLASSAAN